MPGPKKWEQIDEALDTISYGWLSREHPELLEAIESAVMDGVAVEEIKLRVALRTYRYELTLRCEQAARCAVRMYADD